MSAVTIGDNIKKDRAFAVLRKRKFAVICIYNGQRVHPVDAFRMHLVRCNAGSQTRYVMIGHRFAVGPAAHGISVIHDIEDDGEIPFELLFPQRRILIHGSEVHRLIHRSAADGSIPDIADNDSVFFTHFLEKRRTDRDRAGSADDRIVRIDSKRKNKKVHGVSEAFRKTGLSPEKFRNKTVKQESDSQFFRIGLCAVGFDDLQDLSVKNLVHAVQ